MYDGFRNSRSIRLKPSVMSLASSMVETPSLPGSAIPVIGRILDGARSRPDNTALVVRGRSMSYGELADRSCGLAAALALSDTTTAPVAVWADRSETAYLGVLACLIAGRAFVPIGIRSPPLRNLRILALTGCRIFLARSDAGDEAHRLARDAKLLHVSATDAGTPCHTRGHAGPDTTAYIIFTSGSSGQPKGVAVSHGNLSAYVNNALVRHAIQPGDRCSQMFDMTFDLAVHDLLVTWSSGASLHVVPTESLIAPGDFIRKHALTHWFSTPSTAALMGRFGLLAPGCFPSLRVSLFCGEGLPAATAQNWARAAPGSLIDNLYGPTEATVAIMGYRVPADVVRDPVPIGLPFPGQGAMVADSALNPLPAGVEGDLILWGTQLAQGYWQDADLTSIQYPFVPTLNRRCYRTGDRAVFDTADGFLFRGRRDMQVKILGHRVDLMEVEVVVRRIAGTESIAALAWPPGHSADGVIVFLGGKRTMSDAQLLIACRGELPPHMIPQEIHWLESLPQSTSGKTDRQSLVAWRLIK